MFGVLVSQLSVHCMLAQRVIPLNQPLSLSIKAGESTTLAIHGSAGSIEVVEFELGGGLVHLQSAEAARRLLDLGRGGRLQFALQIPESGEAKLELASAERLRLAEVRVRIVSYDERTAPQRPHLLAAGIAFAQADSARRHLPQAPDATTALRDYDLTASEAIAAGEPSLAHWVLAQKARFLLYQKSNFLETRKLLQNLAVAAAGDDLATQGLVYKTLSSCEYYLGDIAPATSDGERALDLYRQTGDRYWQGVVLSNLIAIMAEQGRDTEAAAAAREALTDAEETQDPAGVVFSLTELAGLYRQQGELQSAFQSFQEAQAWAEDIRYAPLVQAQVEESLGRFYMELGMWVEAEEQLKLSLSHTPIDSPTALQARGLLARASEQSGHFASAIREYDRALADAVKLHLPTEEATLLIGRSTTQLLAHRTDAAIKDAHRADQLAREQNSPALRIEATLAEAAACREACTDRSQAAELYQQAISLVEETGKREQEALAYAGLAHVQAALGNFRAALNQIDHALALLEHSRASIASRDLAATLFTQRREWYEFAIDLALQLDRAEPGKGFRETAFRFGERERARAMLDALGQAPRSSSKVDAALAAKIAANIHQIESQEEDLLTSTDSKGLATSLRALYREQDLLEAEERTQGTAGVSLQAVEFASIVGIQNQLLDDETALLPFTSGNNATYRWVITRSSQRVETLPSTAALGRRLASLHQILLSRKPGPKSGEDVNQYSIRLSSFRSERDTALQEAGTILLPLLPSHIRHLYIVSDSSLPSIPWSALRIQSRRHVTYAIERYSIQVEPSATIALSLARRVESRNDRGILIVSDPAPLRAQPALQWAALEKLPGSAREASAIEQEASGAVRMLQGPQATVSNVREALQSNLAVVHFATHTVLIPNHPELSGMALSPGNPSSPSGVLWLHEIPQLHSPPIVVLSGCSTQGANFAGEELKTLAQAFYLAGAQQVIASSWAIDDDASVPLMQAFYRNLLQRNMNAADALRNEQIHMIQEDADLKDWSSFLIGGVSIKQNANGSLVQ